MENKTIAIRASLVRATKIDCFTRDEMPRENKLFFVKNFTGENFKGIYIIGGNDMYYVNEVNQALQMGALYMLSADHCETNFCFKLLLRPAEDYDMFYNPTNVKENKIYYVRNGDDVSGPYCMKNNADYQRVRKALNSGVIYVPCNNQPMEPIIIRKSA